MFPPSLTECHRTSVGVLLVNANSFVLQITFFPPTTHSNFGGVLYASLPVDWIRVLLPEKQLVN
jgi:hypothetical protein